MISILYISGISEPNPASYVKGIIDSGLTVFGTQALDGHGVITIERLDIDITESLDDSM